MMNFLETQKPVLNFLNFFGFFTFSMNSTNVTRNRWQFLHCIIANLVYLGVYFCFHIYFIATTGSYMNDKNETSLFSTNMEGYCLGISMLTVFLSTCWNSSSQMKLINDLLALETKVKALRFSKLDFGKKLHRQTIRTVLGVSTFYIAFIILYSVISLSTHLLLTIVEISFYCCFAFSMNLACIFFDNLAKTIENLFDELSSNFERSVTTCPAFFRREEMIAIFKLHDDLVKCIATFNKAFGTTVLGIYGFNFSVITFEIYFAYSAMVESKGHFYRNFVFFELIGNFVSFIPLYFSFAKFGFTCGNVEEKVDELLFVSSIFKKFLFFPGHETDHPLESSTDRVIFIMR